MRVEVDIQQLREAMALWRYTLAMRDVPLLAADRDRLLDRLGYTVAAWRNLLALCSGQGSDEAELMALRQDVEAVEEWLDEAAYALTILNGETP